MNIILNLLAGAIISYGCSLYFANRKKNIHRKIAEIDSYSKYINQLRQLSIELNGIAYVNLFLVLSLLSIGFAIPVLVEYLNFDDSLNDFVLLFQAIIYIVSAMISFSAYTTYCDILNYQKKLQRLEKKKADLKENLEHL
ncbi:hypothetical protein IQ215_04140 [Cyanobacterium stanieri LEGE 03274]|uniref:DUF2721 domain-containing protein n=1 Tax=Cyanobacterium stanieri LEGE 03274 TaxID=1828756 RepID=A0ABR9V1W6_9CHRO|nr:hypothetical protein [Cyanobacterium stanieri]MBE9221880.1 hypothetical protein [Cyanobacterium stanieri LEGE 03274]